MNLQAYFCEPDDGGCISPSDALDKELETLEAELYRAWLREYEG